MMGFEKESGKVEEKDRRNREIGKSYYGSSYCRRKSYGLEAGDDRK